MKLFPARLPSKTHAFINFLANESLFVIELRLGLTCLFWRCNPCAKGCQFLGKSLVGGIDRDAGGIETKETNGMHIIQNQSIGPVRACPSSIRHAVHATLIGILIGAIEDDPDAGWGLRVES